MCFINTGALSGFAPDFGVFSMISWLRIESEISRDPITTVENSLNSRIFALKLSAKFKPADPRVPGRDLLGYQHYYRQLMKRRISRCDGTSLNRSVNGSDRRLLCPLQNSTLRPQRLCAAFRPRLSYKVIRTLRIGHQSTPQTLQAGPLLRA